jgi:hypothetical protein
MFDRQRHAAFLQLTLSDAAATSFPNEQRNVRAGGKQ